MSIRYNASDKYRAMQRAYARLRQISTNNGNRISNTDARDAVEDFFNHCYHFKDWLRSDGQWNVDKEVEGFITKSQNLSLAADFCNSLKHGGLDRPPRSGKSLENINTHITMALTPQGFVASSRLELTIDGAKHDAFALATNCMNDWDSFLAMKCIIFPEP